MPKQSRLPQQSLASLALLIACAAPSVGAAQAAATRTADSAPAHVDGVRSARALRAAYTSLRNGVAQSAFGEPLHLASRQSPQSVQGNIHAEVPHSFRTVSDALTHRRSWCHILILHPNVKGCRAEGETGRSIAIEVGSAEVPMAFDHRVAAAGADYLRVELGASSGPLGTRDYRMVLEAVPLDDRRTLMHFAYSYDYGMQARLAMQAYLGTLGRDKVGFTVAGRDADGRPVHVDGLRGALERNAMRYYLAIDAFLDSLSAPPGQRPERQLRGWLAGIARYPQLREEEGYVERKRAEIRRQREAS